MKKLAKTIFHWVLATAMVCTAVFLCFALYLIYLMYIS